MTLTNLTCPHCHKVFGDAPVPDWYDELGIKSPDFVSADAWRRQKGVNQAVALEKALAVRMWASERPQVRGESAIWRQFKRYCVNYLNHEQSKLSAGRCGRYYGRIP